MAMFQPEIATTWLTPAAVKAFARSRSTRSRRPMRMPAARPASGSGSARASPSAARTARAIDERVERLATAVRRPASAWSAWRRRPTGAGTRRSRRPAGPAVGRPASRRRRPRSAGRRAPVSAIRSGWAPTRGDRRDLAAVARIADRLHRRWNGPSRPASDRSAAGASGRPSTRSPIASTPAPADERGTPIASAPPPAMRGRAARRPAASTTRPRQPSAAGPATSACRASDREPRAGRARTRRPAARATAGRATVGWLPATRQTAPDRQPAGSRHATVLGSSRASADRHEVPDLLEGRLADDFARLQFVHGSERFLGRAPR